MSTLEETHFKVTFPSHTVKIYRCIFWFAYCSREWRLLKPIPHPTRGPKKDR